MNVICACMHACVHYCTHHSCLAARGHHASLQETVFEDARHLVRSSLDGYNVVIFAYGQTGSGKTHTIYGSAGAPGLAPRGAAELFRLIEADAGRATYSVRLQMLELYQVRLVFWLLLCMWPLFLAHPLRIAALHSDNLPTPLDSGLVTTVPCLYPYTTPHTHL